MDEPRRVIPVILCGGAGTRLWPLSRNARPKPMLALIGAETMLRATARRVGDSSLYAPPAVVAAEDKAAAIEAEVEALGALILEPCARNTAPAIALAALAAAPDDVLLVLPSDHLVRDSVGFDSAVRRTLPLAEAGWIVTFGMKPDRPETGYGWIRRGEALADGVHVAERFVEKPDPASAAAFLADGGYDWNGGLFLMRADRYIDELGRHAPAILDAARSALAAARRDGSHIRPDASAFARSPAQSIDYAVMEKAERVAVAPVSVGWSDIGSFEALWQASDKDAQGNVVVGPGIAVEAGGCFVRSDGPLVAVAHVDDLVVVATADAVLVVPRAKSQSVRELVERLRSQGKDAWT